MPNLGIPGAREVVVLHLSEDKCPKCGWKAPAGLLKCPFCKTYIRKPGSSSSTELKVPDADDLARWSKENPDDGSSSGTKKTTAPGPTSPAPTEPPTKRD